jgi:hypothetical protein
MRFISFTLLSFLLISCGKKNFPDYSSRHIPQRQEDEGGFYKAQFTSLNGVRVEAHSILWTKGFQFYARVVMANGPMRVRFQQNIHKGSRCPVQSDDLNGDGIIDYSEVLKSSGDIIIPLDGKLKSQTEGNDWFPASNKKGRYYYSRSAAIFHILDELRSVDLYPVNGFGRLDEEEDLNLHQRTIILLGSPTDPLLPVACALIKEEYISE